jgi:hypothetical protein
MPDYSFSPQFATIKSSSPLEGMRPFQVPEVRHTALQFEPQKFLEVKSSQPELVSQGWASGLKEGIGDALKGITTAFVDERKAKAEKTEKEAERRNRVLVAKYRGKGTEDEEFQKEYKAAQLENLKSLVEERKNKKEDDDEEVHYGDIDNPTSMDATEVPEDNLPENEMWNLGFPEETEDVLNPLTSLVPTQQDVQALLSKPLSALTANVDIPKQASALEDMQAGNLTPTGASMSTDTQAPEKPASFNILSKNKSLVTPEEARRIQEEFYATTKELPTGFGALSTLPKPEQQQVLAEQKVDEQDLNRYFKTWGDPNVAIKAQKKIAEILGPEYNEAKIEQIKTKKGETGFKVLFPERKTDKELAEEKKGTGVDFDTERKLRDEYIGQTKDFKTIQSAWRSIKTSGKEPSAAGDMSLIFGYMKLLDPASTVREGEYANAQNAAGIPDRIRATFNKAIDGQILSETQRKDFLNQAKKQYESRLGEYNQLKDSYSGLAKQYGLEPKRIILDFNIPEEISESENLANSAKQKFMQMKEMPEGEEKEQLKKELKVLVEQLRATQKK